MVQNERSESKESAASSVEDERTLGHALPASELLNRSTVPSSTVPSGAASASTAPTNTVPASTVRPNGRESYFSTPTTHKPPAPYVGALEHSALFVEAKHWLTIIPPNAACYRLLQLGLLRRDVALLEGLLSVLRHT